MSIANDGKDIAERVIREFNLLQGTRGVWEQHWQEIAERIWPTVSRSFNPFWYTTPGNKRNEFVFDSTAALALNRFAAILDSLLTPRNQTWHSLRASDKNLQKRRDVQLWFEEVTRILFDMRYSPRANFSAQNQIIYKNLGAFGSGCMFIDELQGSPGLRYRAVFLGEVYFTENHQGIVDKAFRYFTLTARQAFQKWREKCPKNIIEIGKNQPEQIFHFIHLVEPRQDVNPIRKDFKGKPYASYYVSKEEGELIEEGGYTSFPYAIPRYEQGPNEVYGRSPAMDLLPAIKTLNEEKKTLLKQGHRALDPVLLVHDDGILDGFSLRPGALNAGGVSAEGRPLVHTLPVGDVKIGKEMMDDERELIKDGFLVSLFQILTENPQMTATEVMERQREKGILLAPTIGRQQSEYLGPMIDRELDLLSAQGLLPPMPPALLEARGQYKVHYDSPLTRAQRAEQSAGLLRTIESLLPIVQATSDPTPLDFYDWDAITPELSDIGGVPFHWLKSAEQVGAVRQNRELQKQQEAMIQAAPGAAAMLNATTKSRQA
jgi:hypothetical protein